MPVRVSDLPHALVERVEAAHPAPAVFAADEIAGWPDGALETLLNVGLLEGTRRARTLICEGCEWSCVKPVVVRLKRFNGAHTAFITCDEERDFGRIAVPLQRLAQYRSTLSMMASFLAKELDISGEPKLQHPASILLGLTKGRYGDRAISLVLHNRRLELRVGRQQEALARCLRWESARIQVNRATIRRFANRKEQPTSAASRYQPDRSGQEKRKRETAREDQKIIHQARYRRRKTGDSWTSIAAQIAKTPLAFRKSGRRLTASRVRRITGRKK
jgi:hypothetical protein